MPVISAPSQSQIEEFKRRRKMIEYTLCYDEDIWNEMEKEEKEAIRIKEQEENKTKPVLVASPQLETRINAFLLDIFQNEWLYSQEEIDLAKQNLKPEMISPANIAWNQRRQDVDDSKSGQYTLNPETQNLDFERAKVKIKKIPKNMTDKSLADIAKYIQIAYGSKYHIPGIEYLQYIYQNPDKAPSALKNDKNYYFYFYFSSILRDQDGYWCIPHLFWNGSSFEFDVNMIDNDLNPDDRVVLLEK